ncbi:MAG: hypothetical protein ACOCWH_00040 [Spirochaetota bacterium]
MDFSLTWSQFSIAENKPSTLGSQLEMLEEIGFRDVDCYLKKGIFDMFGGNKS